MAQRHCYELAAPAKVVEVLELKSLTAIALGYKDYLTFFGWWYWVMVVDSSPGAKIQRQNNQQENERDGHTD